MHATEMLCHLVDAMRVARGETTGGEKWTPFRFFPMRWVFVHLLPWPRGKLRTMPQFQQTRPSQLDDDRLNWGAALDRFVAEGRQPEPRWRPHPAFGALPNWEWGRLMYRHIDHHFQQFGV
jgi:hypothetical protein